jgi:hypothetical protein
MESKGLLTIDIDDYGREVWEVAHAVLALYEMPADEEDDDDEEDDEADASAAPDPNKPAFEMLVELRMGAAQLRVPELEEAKQSSPSLQVRVFLTQSQRPLLPGMVLEQASDYDEVEERYLSNCVYFEHHGIVNVRIEVLDITEKGRRLRVSGETVISNYGKGSPDARFEAVVDAQAGRPYFQW